jgi:hypothetical protein
MSNNADLGWGQRRRMSRTRRMFIHKSESRKRFSASARVFKQEGIKKNRWNLKKGASTMSRLNYLVLDPISSWAACGARRQILFVGLSLKRISWMGQVWRLVYVWIKSVACHWQWERSLHNKIFCRVLSYSTRDQISVPIWARGSWVALTPQPAEFCIFFLQIQPRRFADSHDVVVYYSRILQSTAANCNTLKHTAAPRHCRTWQQNR